MSDQEDRAQVFGMTLAIALLAAGSVCGGTNTVTVVPPVLDAALRNPMKGFIPHLKELSYPAKSRPPLDYVTLVRHYIRWDDLEETEADGVEKIKDYCDKAWAGLPERNIKVIPRVLLQWSAPKWAKKPGDWWTCWPKDMTTGDWESDQFRDRVRKMVKKLGEAWDDDPRVAWVNMAIMGAWGEHHAPGFTPEMEKIFGDAFTAAFRNKKVTVRRPEQFADYAFGLDIDNWNERNHWIYDGTASAKKFGDFIRTTHRQLISPIEGEIAYAYPTERKHDFCGDSPDDTLGRQERLDFHVNTLRYFGCTALGWINRYHATNAAVCAGVDLCQRTWGYRYVLDEVTYPVCAVPGGELNVRVSLHNTGSAPFYCKWPVTASLLDPQTRAVVWEEDFDTDIRTWAPGLDWDMTNRCYGVPAPQTSFATAFRLPPNIRNGRYILALAVLDPAGRRPSLRFATSNYFNGGRHPIGYLTVGSTAQGGPELSDVTFDDPNADTSLRYAMKRVAVVPLPQPSGLRNPMKGFIPHLKELSYPAKSRPPLDYVTLVRHYIRWDDLEETEADGVEKIRAYCDKAWAGLPERNIKVIPRVILQWSGPKWAKKPGDWWTCWPKDMTVGDWESEQFKDRVRKMVKKLGEAWDDDPRVAWVNMAIMGAWGEHHAPGFTPEMEKLFGDAFTAAFRNKKVTVRQGNQFRDYCFGIDWCAWGDVVQWNGKSPQYAHWMRELVRMTRRQMFAPFEGEIVYAWPKDRLALGAGVTPDETLTRPDRLSYVQDTVRVLGGSALGWVNRYHPTNQAIRVGASALEKTFGYRYEIGLVRFDSRVGADGGLSVDVRLRNTGSAPFYYRWPVTACLLDPQTREPVWEGDFDTDIRTWLPGEDWDLTNRVYRTPAPEVSFAMTFVVPPTVKNGRYVLALAVLDPAGRLPSLRFATRNYFNGGRHPVGFVSVGCREDGGPLPADMRFDDPNADMSLHYRGGNVRDVRSPEAGNEKVSAARVRAERLLRRWGDGLKALQLTVPDRPELKGALACPACGMMHGRICDAAYPLVYLADKTGERSYLTAAERAIDWCEANMLLPDGLYRNDRQSYWRSTSAFFTVSLWKALRVGGERLPLQTREKWRRIFLRASRALYDFYEGGFDPNVNYRCIYPLAMHLAWRETGDDRYAAAARRMADEIRERFFNDDGLLVGEGRVKGAWDGKTPRGCQPVDVAYNLEESLAALIEYANLVGDGLLRERAVMSAKAHFAFVLPDGAIDESCSARLHKWTYYGSRTADGILSLLALLERDVPYAGRMAERVLALHERCTGNDGLLRGGLMYDEAGEPPCVHHTFVRMKALADYLREGTFSGSEPFPRERTPQCVRIPSLDAFLIASGPWRATFTANDAYNTADSQSVVSGGTLSLLWHESLGPLAAGTPGKFTYREPHNMQDDRHDMSMRCLAPRLVAEKWSNIFDTAVRTQGAMEGERFSYSAVGDGYEIAYKLSSDGISLSARCVRPGARLVLPIVAAPDERVEIADRTVRIRRRSGTVVVTADTPVTVAPCDRGERIWSPVTGLLCVPLTLPVRDGGVSVRLTVETDERNEG